MNIPINLCDLIGKGLSFYDNLTRMKKNFWSLFWKHEKNHIIFSRLFRQLDTDKNLQKRLGTFNDCPIYVQTSTSLYVFITIIFISVSVSISFSSGYIFDGIRYLAKYLDLILQHYGIGSSIKLKVNSIENCVGFRIRLREHRPFSF